MGKCLNLWFYSSFSVCKSLFTTLWVKNRTHIWHVVKDNRKYKSGKHKSTLKKKNPRSMNRMCLIRTLSDIKYLYPLLRRCCFFLKKEISLGKKIHEWASNNIHKLYINYVLLYTWVVHSCPTLCNPMDCSPPGSSVQVNSPDKNSGVGCHSLLQRIFPT